MTLSRFQESSRRGSPFSAGAVLGALTVLASSLAADTRDSSRQAFLELGTATPGSSLTVLVRSPHPGSFVVLGLGFDPAAIPLGPDLDPWLIAPPWVFRTGLVFPNGLFGKAFSVPLDYPPGVPLYFQGSVVTPGGEVFGTNRAQVRPGTTSSLSITDGTSLLDNRTGLFEASDVDWGDFDKDGLPDAFVANDGYGYEPLLLMNHGAGSPTLLVDEAALRLPLAARVALSVVEVGDVDNDGDQDLFVGGGLDDLAAAPNLLLLNDGAGWFSLASHFPPGLGRAHDAVFADVDSDGDLDLFVANRADPDHPGEVPDATVLYLNQGGVQGGILGEFVADATFASLGANDPHFDGGDLSVGDLDLDGDLDLFMARSASSGEQNLLFVNDGTGVFTDSTASLPVRADKSLGSVLGDFNGDLLLDVWVSNSDVTQAGLGALLMNLGPVGSGGALVFVDASANVPASLGPAHGIRLGAEAFDADSDGDLDIVVAIHEFFDPTGPPGATAGESVLLVNQGGAQGGTQGEFLVDPGFGTFGPFIDGDVSPADVNNDGVMDVYVGSGGDFNFIDPPQDKLILGSL
jgi:hypothetical protein